MIQADHFKFVRKLAIRDWELAIGSQNDRPPNPQSLVPRPQSPAPPKMSRQFDRAAASRYFHDTPRLEWPGRQR